MKVRLLSNVVFEYGGMRKTMWVKGDILQARNGYAFVIGPRGTPVLGDVVDGYWITTGERTKPPEGASHSGALYETKCFLSEAEIVET